MRISDWSSDVCYSALVVIDFDDIASLHTKLLTVIGMNLDVGNGIAFLCKAIVLIVIRGLPYLVVSPIVKPEFIFFLLSGTVFRKTIPWRSEWRSVWKEWGSTINSRWRARP